MSVVQPYMLSKIFIHIHQMKVFNSSVLPHCYMTDNLYACWIHVRLGPIWTARLLSVRALSLLASKTNTDLVIGPALVATAFWITAVLTLTDHCHCQNAVFIKFQITVRHCLDVLLWKFWKKLNELMNQDNRISRRKPKIGADHRNWVMDLQYLDSTTWLELIYSSTAMKWHSIGVRLIYVKHHDRECKLIHKENRTLIRFGGQIYHLFIHWFSLVITVFIHE